VSVNQPLLTFECMNHSFIKLGMYITTLEPISEAYFVNPSHQFVSVYASLQSLLGKFSVKYIHIPLFFARQRLGKHVPGEMNTRNNRRIVGRVCLWVYLCILLSLLGNNSVLPRTSCFKIRKGGKGKVVHVLNIISTVP
jgi:hypothetical protein